MAASGDASYIRQRNLILALLVALSAACWFLLYRQEQAAGMGALMQATMGMTFPLFLAVWVVMMAAMMFPAAAPMVLTFHRVQSNQRQKGRPFVPTWIFIAGYMVVWTAAGVVAFCLALAGEWLARRAGWPAATVARLGGAMLVAAGAYELTPLKALCLSKCRTPITFIMTSWRSGNGGAFRMGIEHGLYCLGCCWLLFLILFPLGMMNVAAMALLTALILAEKTFPRGKWTVQAAAALLIAYGAAVVLNPALLPTFMVM